MRRAGRILIKQAREERLEFLRRNLPVLAVGAVCYVAICAPVLIFAGHLRDFVAGMAVVGYPWFVTTLMQKHRLSSRKVDGAFAEEWTTQNIRKGRRAGWRVLDNIPFGRFNVDHVAWGPNGIIAIETKFTSSDWEITPGGVTGAMGDPLQQAYDRAHGLHRLLVDAGLDIRVLPALAIWGAGCPDHGAVLRREVLILSGKRAKEWRTLPPTGSPLTEGEIERVEAVLRNHIKQRESVDRESVPTR